MKYRFGACAALLLLAACHDGSVGLNDQVVTSASSAGPLLGLTAGRSASGASIANAPDHGALMEYGNGGRPMKREGAHTWYPVQVSENHAIRAIVAGEMTVPYPDGTQAKLRYERHVEGPDGNWSWIGRVEGGDPGQEAIFTFGEKAVFASIPQPNGQPPLELRSANGSLWAVISDPDKLVIPDTAGDTKIPVPGAGGPALMSTLAEAQHVTAGAVAAAATQAAGNTIDVAIGYTTGFRAVHGSQSAAVTRLNFLIEVGNQTFRNSNVNGYLRLVHAVEVNYTDATSNESALEQLTVRDGESASTVPASLAPLRTARDTYGADIAILVRKFSNPENEGCGIAWINGAGGEPITPAAYAEYGYAVAGDGSDIGTDGKTYYCSDETLIHESAHLMGSSHELANSPEPGAFPYSYGYVSTTYNFRTVMAYGSPTQTLYRTFSNPQSTYCGGRACGIADASDNARSLTQTIPAVALFRQKLVLDRVVSQDKYGMNRDGKADLLWRNELSAAVAYWLMSSSQVLTTANVAPLVPSTYRQIGRGDLNADGYIDSLWTSDARDVWLWTGTGNSFNAEFVANYPDDWEPISVADTNGDGRSDIIFRNVQTRKVALWIMNGRVATSIYNVFAEVPPDYRLAGTGDFNGDGKSDILWTNTKKRDLWAWISNGSEFSPILVDHYPQPWRPTGTGDMNGDGRSDILWRNAATSQVAYWIMNGPTVVTTRNATPLAPASYWIASIGDYDGDTHADIMWTSSGRDLWAWFGDGTDFSPSFVANYPPNWSPEPGGP